MSPSSKSCLAPYWTTKQLLANLLVQFGCVGHQTPKSKVNGPRIHFSYNLTTFWWLMTTRQKKQIIKILEFKNYLLARMQCKGQCYMMLKYTTCKLKIPQVSYCVPHVNIFETYLDLANVSMWYYGFKPPSNSIIRYPPFLRPLPLVNYYDRACFWSYKFSPLESNTENVTPWLRA